MNGKVEACKEALMDAIRESEEYLQYEDDDYYYYVKAVPKIKMTQSSRSVKTIETEEDPDMDVQR